MIDRVNNVKYYEYKKTDMQKKEPVDSSEFRQNLEKQGVIYEKSEQKKSAKAKGTEKEADSSGMAMQANEGVKLEISGQGYEKAQRREKLQGASFVENVKKFAKSAVDFLKLIWDRVWNEPNPAKEEVTFPEALEGEMERQAQDISVNRAQETGPDIEEVRALFRRGSRKEIEDFISNHGERRLARNTELLTQYDRSGSLVNMGSTEKELILHGNRNEVRL